MKKLIGLSSVILITASVFAQDTIPPASTQNRDTSLLTKNVQQRDSLPSGGSTVLADRVVMKDDQVIVIRNGDSTVLADSIKLESGAVVMKDGSVTYTSGKAVKLQNGQFVSLNAEQNNKNNNSDSSSTTTAMPKDRIVMMGDKVMLVKNGDSTLLEDSIKLSSGAVVKRDASVTFNDGTTSTLKNGQYIEFSPAETKSAPADTTSMSTAKTKDEEKVVEDRVVMKDDKVFIVKNGDSTLLEESIKLASGAVVNKDASVKFKDGTTTKLKNGQFIAMKPAATQNKKTTKTSTKKVTSKKKEKDYK